MMIEHVTGKLLTNERARRAVEERRRGQAYKLLEADVAYVGSGEEWDESLADSAAKKLDKLVRSLKTADKQIDVFEFDRYACVTLHKTLALPAHLAASDGFWRWLAVEKFAEIIEARHSYRDNPARLRNYGINARSDSNRVTILWLRADILYDADAQDPYHLASRPMHADFVESGIIRPRYAWCRNLARAFVRFQYRDAHSRKPYLSITNNDPEGVRMMYKRLRRLHSTTAFEFLSDGEMDTILHDSSRNLNRT